MEILGILDREISGRSMMGVIFLHQVPVGDERGSLTPLVVGCVLYTHICICEYQVRGIPWPVVSEGVK